MSGIFNKDTDLPGHCVVGWETHGRDPGKIMIQGLDGMWF